MGARAQVLIEDTGVYLYTHWGADNIESIVQGAIDSQEGQNRLTDSEYLTRIIFERMLQDASNKETGYGIGTQQHSDIEKLVTVDTSGAVTVVEV
jgi:hypothetical protein